MFRVVKSVLAKDESQSDEIQWIQPSNDAVQGDSDTEKSLKKYEKKPLTRSSSIEKSIKTGATRIMNPKNKKRMETYLVEKDSSEDQFNRFFARKNSDVDEINWIQPGTTADDDDTCEMGQNSMLQDFKETISETLSHLHLPHHAYADGVIYNKHGLVETAMETMLMEQATILGAKAVAASSDQVEAIKFADKRNSSIESFKKLLGAPFRRRSNDSNETKKEPKKDKFSLFDSAMKTMLNETAHIIEGVGVHPKSFDKGDADVKPDEVDKLPINSHIEGNVQKIDANEPKVECFEAKSCEMLSKHECREKLPTQSYFMFCDNLTTSHILTNDKPAIVTADDGCQSTGEMPVLMLTKCASKQNKKDNHEIDSNAHIDSKSLQSDSVSVDNKKKHSSKTMRTTNHELKNKPTLIHNNNCHSSDLINHTNKTKLLAPASEPKHRSHDEKSTQDNSTSSSSSKQHIRTESYGTKLQASPTKVTTSSSSYNTTSAGTSTTSNLSSVKGKDGKDTNDIICRRSSDSDLSVPSKGNTSFYVTILHKH